MRPGMTVVFETERRIGSSPAWDAALEVRHMTGAAPKLNPELVERFGQRSDKSL
jgi:hypothetical protein